jgi:nucleotide-binding universal stress UspA family protein
LVVAVYATGHGSAGESGHASREDALADAVDVAKESAGTTRCETVLAPGAPPEALLETARQRSADELVVGSRGFGGVNALGSVSRELIRIADRPVSPS